jgi:uncharacterized Zn finger protein (UPF0148 family)
MQMAAATCPNCGADVPLETVQHALVPVAGVVECPSCGATFRLERPDTGADVERAETPPDVEEDFSGHETLEGVMDEVREKEDGEQ